MRWFVISSVIALVGGCAPRASAELETAQPAACQGDEFALPGFNKANPQECLDVTSYRALRLFDDKAEYERIATRFGLRQALARLRQSGVEAAQAEYKLAANFKHEGEFWVAQIPTRGKVLRTIFQVSEFRLAFSRAFDALSPEVRNELDALSERVPFVKTELDRIRSGYYTAAHGQLRMTFSEPILLASHANPQKQTSLNELVLSVHAVSPGSVPDSYDPIRGMGNSYGTSMGLYSVADKIEQAIGRHVAAGRQPSRVRQYLLSLESDKVDLVISRYLSNARSVWENVSYNTVTRNCGSEIFEVFDQVLGLNSRGNQGLALLGRQYPKYAQFALAKHGLLTFKSGEEPDANGFFRDDQLAVPLPSLNHEAGYPEPDET